jgi:hypothetical protein
MTIQRLINQNGANPTIWSNLKRGDVMPISFGWNKNEGLKMCFIYIISNSVLVKEKYFLEVFG